MAEPKRNFSKVGNDILDEMRAILEAHADVVNPGGDLSIRDAEEFATDQDSILDRMRAALHRITAHSILPSTLRIKGNTVVQGTPSSVIAPIIGQYEYDTPDTINYPIYSMTNNQVVLADVPINYIYPNKITLANTDGGDDGTYSTIISVSYNQLYMRLTIIFSDSPLSGLSTSGDGLLITTKLAAVTNIPTGLTTGDTVAIVGSDNADGKYVFDSEIAHPVNANQYLVFLEEEIVPCTTYGDFGTIQEIDDLVITNPFSSIYITILAFQPNGYAVTSYTSSGMTITSASITLSSSILTSMGFNVGDTVYYSIDSHA